MHRLALRLVWPVVMLVRLRSMGRCRRRRVQRETQRVERRRLRLSVSIRGCRRSGTNSLFVRRLRGSLPTKRLRHREGCFLTQNLKAPRSHRLILV